MESENPIRNDSVTVDAASQVISVPQSRKNIYLRNTSVGGQVITVTFSNKQAAVANYGYVLNPGEYISDTDSGTTYECWDGYVLAIASANGGQLTIVERAG